MRSLPLPFDRITIESESLGQMTDQVSVPVAKRNPANRGFVRLRQSLVLDSSGYDFAGSQPFHPVFFIL